MRLTQFCTWTLAFPVRWFGWFLFGIGTIQYIDISIKNPTWIVAFCLFGNVPGLSLNAIAAALIPIGLGVLFILGGRISRKFYR